MHGERKAFLCDRVGLVAGLLPNAIQLHVYITGPNPQARGFGPKVRFLLNGYFVLRRRSATKRTASPASPATSAGSGTVVNESVSPYSVVPAGKSE